MIPVGAVGITELEGVMMSVLPDDVVIPVELVSSRIPALTNVPVVIKEVAVVMKEVLLETREYEHK